MNIQLTSMGLKVTDAENNLIGSLELSGEGLLIKNNEGDVVHKLKFDGEVSLNKGKAFITLDPVNHLTLAAIQKEIKDIQVVLRNKPSP